METLVEFMSKEHKACDKSFAIAEEAAFTGNWRAADDAFKTFLACMARHFRMEEDYLFPALIDAGGPAGPIQVMTMEHAQMDGLLVGMASHLASRNLQAYSGQAETLLILMQQHNLKEEQILYPLAQRFLSSRWDELHKSMLAIA